VIQRFQNKKTCFVLGFNVSTDLLSDAQILFGSKGQPHREQGYRFLKDDAPEKGLFLQIV
jgi:hypothetical protein